LLSVNYVTMRRKDEDHNEINPFKIDGLHIFNGVVSKLMIGLFITKPTTKLATSVKCPIFVNC